MRPGSKLFIRRTTTRSLLLSIIWCSSLSRTTGKIKTSLLGFECAMDEQCAMKVSNSYCEKGKCRCEPNFLPLRFDKCLPPARIDDYCLKDEQCHLASRHSFCKYIIPRIYGKCRCPAGYLVRDDRRCLPGLGSACSNDEECVTPGSFCKLRDRVSLCSCLDGFVAANQGKSCKPIEKGNANEKQTEKNEAKNDVNDETFVVSLGKSCQSNDQCQARDPYSSCVHGVCQCISNSSRCNSSYTGCATEAFECNDGTCLSKSVVCDEKWDCPDGSDEARCYKGISCDKNAFQCDNGECLPQFVFCNVIKDCTDGSDEKPEVCSQADTCPSGTFQCNSGQCRSTAILCSGLDGCGDNSDEDRCEVCYCKEP
ncbi:uncharacterized protein LOC143246123 isoform X2 [Tachypleus tridentatus]|uniref:uncharacterized protein LOC143246123 isoform X2 n=1 Tax=Tachypleus tridentatus TaxID=6853 RepID=UPI003FD53289